MLYAAHIGWLNSSVKISAGRDKKESKTKLEYFGKQSLIARLPDLEKASYIAEHWNDCGKVSSNGFGVNQLSWQEMESYRNMNRLSEWESLIVHAMSRMYVLAKNMFDDAMCECPYRFEDKPMLELQLLSVNPIESAKINKAP
ncbi:hypothetical protein [Vibrio phage P23]|nr:hypothetical protein [Vibrio phage P23]